jgi:hypothetical protein
MRIREAKALARQWVEREGATLPSFAGAFFAGSVLWQADEAVLAPTSEVDLWIVLAGAMPAQKLGKLVYHGVILEVSYLTLDQLASPEQVLADYHMAGHFRQPSVIADPMGRLHEIQQRVAQEFAQQCWVPTRLRQDCAQSTDAGSHRGAGGSSDGLGLRDRNHDSRVAGGGVAESNHPQALFGGAQAVNRVQAAGLLRGVAGALRLCDVASTTDLGPFGALDRAL